MRTPRSTTDSLRALSEPEELDLRGYLRIFTRRKGLILLSTAVLTVLALTFALRQETRYVARAELTFPLAPAEVWLNNIASSRSAETEARTLTGTEVRARVEGQVGAPVPTPTVTRVGEERILEVSVSAGDAQRAASVANAYAEVYLELRRTTDIANLDDAEATVSDHVAELEKRIAEIDAGASSGVAISEHVTLQGRLNDEQARLAQIDLARQVYDDHGTIVTRATAPEPSSAISPLQASALGGIGGLMLGLALAVLLHWRAGAIVDQADLIRIVGGSAVLGCIPVRRREERDGPGPPIAVLQAPNGRETEAFRVLRTALQAQSAERAIDSLLVTGAAGGEGTTTTAASLAVLFAQSGRRVALVDGNLRDPAVHRCFGLSNQTGLASVVDGSSALADALQEVPSVPGLRILAAGASQTHPAELLSSPGAEEMLAKVASDFDLVIIDSPPLLAVTDASVAGMYADAALVVVGAGTSSRREMQDALELLARLDVPVAGFVLNRADPAAAPPMRSGIGGVRGARKRRER